MPRTAILFLTHALPRWVLRRFQALRQECAGRGCDVFLLHDVTRGARHLPNVPLHTFDLASIRSLGFPLAPLNGRSPRIVPGHCDYPLLHFYLAHPDYDWYWLVEYDVCFTGNWRHFFAAWDRSRSDLLASYVQRRADCPSWWWWRSFQCGGAAVESAQMIRAFCPIYRLSKRACEVLATEYPHGWSGHQEARVPTVLHINGCSLEDFGGDGEFVAPGNLNKFYIGNDLLPSGVCTFRWRPVMSRPGTLAGKLWHPVKPNRLGPAHLCKRILHAGKQLLRPILAVS